MTDKDMTSPTAETQPQEGKIPVTVFKIVLSEDDALRIAESNKLKPFGGGGFFSKIKKEDIEVANVALLYIPYELQTAKYKIDYYRKNSYTVPVDNIISEVIILGNTFNPEKGEDVRNSNSESIIKLDADERIVKVTEDTAVIDRFGKEAPLSVIPKAEKENDPERVISIEGDSFMKPTGLKEYATNLLKLKIAQHPAEAIRINSEAFNIIQTMTNYIPVYNAVLRNKKTGDTKTIFIDAIASKVVEV